MQFSAQHIVWHTVGAQYTFVLNQVYFGEHFHFIICKVFFFLSFMYSWVPVISLLILYWLNNLLVLLGGMQSWPYKTKKHLKDEPIGSRSIWICIQVETQKWTRLGLVQNIQDETENERIYTEFVWMLINQEITASWLVGFAA